MGKKYSSEHCSVEVKLEAVRQVLEMKRSVAGVALELNKHRDTVNRWVKAYKVDGPEGLEDPRTINTQSSVEDRKRIRELEKQVKEKELENEILKKFQAFLKVRK